MMPAWCEPSRLAASTQSRWPRCNRPQARRCGGLLVRAAAAAGAGGRRPPVICAASSPPPPPPPLLPAGRDWASLCVQDCSAAQLQALHLGGRAGLRVPTLRAFLQAVMDAGGRCTLAIEVKALRTDAGRQRFLDTVRRALDEVWGGLCGAGRYHRAPRHGSNPAAAAALPTPCPRSWYLAVRGPALDADPEARRRRFKRLGWAGVIAFPHLWAASFGPFGGGAAAAWAAAFRRRRIPVRACHATWWPLIGGW